MNKQKARFNIGGYKGEWQVIFVKLAENILPPDIFRDLANAAREMHLKQKDTQNDNR